jgi:predicted SnoaL-like aldol condensation-catalyzing enzyme
VCGPNPSGRSMIDGPIEARDLDKTEANEALVERFVGDVLVDGQMDKFAGYCDGDRYIQHHPQIAYGVSNLAAAFKAWAEAGIVAEYDRIHRVLGEGDFVLVVGEGQIQRRTHFLL